ncbi:hypothetical protein BaRGS_00038991, partial [Batillaria attramentaria]
MAETANAGAECDVCGKDHVTEECPVLGLSTSNFTPQISRARLTVPHYLGIVDYADGEVGIVATEAISNKTQLGPFEAKKTTYDISRDDIFVLKIISTDGNTISLDASSENHCNWMALVQVAKTAEEQNCMAYQLGINIYFNTTRDIPEGDSLRVWYAPQYAKKLGRPVEPDGKAKSMLGEDMTWKSDQGQSADGIVEAAAYLTSVLPAGSSAGDTIIIKQEGGELYNCRYCTQVFFNENEFAIHLRGHIAPSSVMSTRGRRGRPWGKAGVTRPMGKRGPGRPRKPKVEILPVEEGEVQNTTPRRGPGRPRKHPIVEPPGIEGEDLAGTSAENTKSNELGEKEGGDDAQETLADSSTGENIEQEDSPEKSAAQGVSEADNEQAKSSLVDEASPDKEPSSGSNQAADTAVTALAPKRGRGRPRKRPLSLEQPQNDSETTPSEISGNAEKEQEGAPVPHKVTTTPPKKRGRPPKRVLEPGEIVASPAPPPQQTSASPRRVQPRRTLKGKRTSTFRYPGESDSEEDEETAQEEKKVKGKNVLKKVIKSATSDEEEEGEIRTVEYAGETEGLITVSTPDGVVLSKAPVILLDQETGQTLDASTLSVLSTGIDSSGQQVVVLQTTANAGDPGATSIVDGSAETAVTDEQGETVLTAQPDALAALVDAALSSEKINGTTEGGRGEIKSEENDDTVSDDPDWVRSQSSGSGTPRNYRPRRRKGENPALDELEESTKVITGSDGKKEFVCGACSKRFSQLKYLRMHLPAHTDKFLCNDCGRRFARHESLQKHICEDSAQLVERLESAEDGLLTFRCRECGRIFPEYDHARRHVSMHRGVWACNKCQRTFPKRQILLDHVCGQTTTTETGESAEEDSMQGGTADSAGDGEAEGEDNYQCDICKQAFRTSKYLFRHMAMHTELFKCEECGKCYSRKDSLQRHILKCCPRLAEDYSVHACDKCKKTFGTRLGLENHMLNCGKFQCDNCRTAFFSEEDLSSHKCEGKIIDDATGVQFPCKECGKTFASLAYLSRHEASHHAAFECEVCKKVFVRKEELDWHTPVCIAVNEIERDGTTNCNVCQTAFTDVRLFKDHFQTHTHPYRCEKCGKRFIKVGTLHTHKCDGVVAPGSEGDGVWHCDLCEKTFKTERYLARHKTLHGVPSFDCEYCGKKFIRKDYLNDHQCVLPDGTSVRMVRKKNRLYIRDDLRCPRCNKAFSSKSNLNKHIRVHGEREAECHICGKKFHYESYLKLHVATVHDRQYQYQCAHCGKILFSKTGLVAHIKQFHQDSIKLFPCPKCGKTFRQKGNMKTHLYSHTKEKSFRCDLCPKAFKYPDQLNRHRLEHTMKDKIQCDHCEKQFVRAHELRQHLRLAHSGVIYTCNICHESCAHKHTIVRHYRRKHPEMASVLEEQPDFLTSLQKPADKAMLSGLSNPLPNPVRRIPIQLTAPGGAGDQKPRIIRVMADGQEQEYIITSTTAPMVSESGEEDSQELPYTAVSAAEAESMLPEVAAQALSDLSGAVLATDGTSTYQTVEGPDGQQTVIILQ